MDRSNAIHVFVAAQILLDSLLLTTSVQSVSAGPPDLAANPFADDASVTYQLTCDVYDSHRGRWRASRPWRIMASGQSKERVETSLKCVYVRNRDQVLELDLRSNRATISELSGPPRGSEMWGRTWHTWRLRRVLARLQSSRDPAVRCLGEADLEDKTVVGYLLLQGAWTWTIWLAPDHSRPLQFQAFCRLRGYRMVYDDFRFEVEHPESLLNTKPPPGSRVSNRAALKGRGRQPEIGGPYQESDFLEMLRYWSEHDNGCFPHSISSLPGHRTHSIWVTSHKVGRGLFFAATQLPDADAHYAGKGVKMGDKDRPVYWYRPKDQEIYRIVWADLSTTEADTAPIVPGAQPTHQWLTTAQWTPWRGPAAGRNLNALLELAKGIGVLPAGDEPCPDAPLDLRVMPDSVAYHAGLRTGDRILEIGGEQAATLSDALALWRMIAYDSDQGYFRPPKEISATVMRGGLRTEVTLTEGATTPFAKPPYQRTR